MPTGGQSPIGGQRGGVVLALTTTCKYPPEPQQGQGAPSPDKNVLTVDKLGRLNLTQLDRLIAVLLARPKLSPKQLALLQAALAQRIKVTPAVGSVDPALIGLRPGPHTFAGEVVAESRIGVNEALEGLQGLFDSADQTVPNVPKFVIGQVLQRLFELASLPAGIVVEGLTPAHEHLPFNPGGKAGSGAFKGEGFGNEAEAKKQALALKALLQQLKIGR